MRNFRAPALPVLSLLLFPLTAQAALTPVGSPLPIADESPCSFISELEVIATPKGAFDVVWVDGWEEIVKGRRFDRALNPAPPVNILPMHAGINYVDIDGTWAGRYEVAMNVLDYGTDPSDPRISTPSAAASSRCGWRSCSTSSKATLRGSASGDS